MKQGDQQKREEETKERMNKEAFLPTSCQAAFESLWPKEPGFVLNNPAGFCDKFNPPFPLEERSPLKDNLKKKKKKEKFHFHSKTAASREREKRRKRRKRKKNSFFFFSCFF